MPTDHDYYENNQHGNDKDLTIEECKMEALKIELDLAYSSEKVLNLDLFVMHVNDMVRDFETLGMEKDDVSISAIEKALEADILSGFLDSEVKELNSIMNSYEKRIADIRGKIAINMINVRDQMSLGDMEKKLLAAEQYVNKSQDQLHHIKGQITKFDAILQFPGKESCNTGSNEYLEKCSSSTDNIWKMQSEQKRHILQMLEKSLARELDLDKKLADASHTEEEIIMKLHYAEKEVHFMEEELETILERSFEAENAAEILEQVSKELIGKFQHVQLMLSGSKGRETETRHNLEENMQKLDDAKNIIQEFKNSEVNLKALVQRENELKDALKLTEEKYSVARSEVFSLRIKVNLLEEKLKEYNTLLQETKASHERSLEQQSMLNAELEEMGNVILDLRDNFFVAESRAHSAEAKCTLLAETNLELNEELGYLKSSETEKSKSLEVKLRESDAQLEDAKESVEAIKEQQNMLCSTLTDMQTVVENLKKDVSQAEKKAEKAESRCDLLTRTNLELNEELGLERNKLEYLEKSLHKTDGAKIAAAIDIDAKTKIISNLVMKLAVERERLQMQITTLRKENKFLVKKFRRSSEINSGRGKEISFQKSSAETFTESSISNTKLQGASPVVIDCKEETDRISSEDDNAVESKLMPVRNIQAGELQLKHVACAFLVTLLAVTGAYIFQMKTCPF